MEFLSLTGGCRGWSESTLVKMPHCWKSHVTATMAYQSMFSSIAYIAVLRKNGDRTRSLSHAFYIHDFLLV